MFEIINNWTKKTIVSLTGFELIEAMAYVENVADCDWVNIYYIGEDHTNLEAVYDDGTWYESDGCTVLNY